MNQTCQSCLRLAVAISIVSTTILAFAGCGRSQGKKAFEFLKTEREIIDNTIVELKKCPNPKPPSRREVPAGFHPILASNAQKAFNDEMSQYLNAVAQYSRQIEHIVNNAETTLSRLDSSGTGDEVITLTKDYEQLLGDLVQWHVEIRAIAELKKTELSQNKKVAMDLAVDLINAAMTEGLTTGAFLKSVASDMKQKIELDKELQSHHATLQKVVAELEHYRGEVVTKRTELVTSYRAQYPEYEWDSVLPK